MRSIIGCACAVGNGLGIGLFEMVYENALASKLRKSGFTVDQQRVVDIVCEEETGHGPSFDIPLIIDNFLLR